jgi:hypothetical protein
MKSVVVLGMAGWETKFTIRALEERGWIVESRVALAPRLATGLGQPFPLDTARHAAVIALDSSAGVYAGNLLQYVRSGGGLILGEAASAYLARLAPAGGGDLIRPAFAPSGRPVSRQLLGFRSLPRLRDGAAVLESRAGRVAVAAWRVGAGRVAQSGYRETWRWRMEGGETGLGDHRAWWAGLVATVAYRPSVADQSSMNPAPLASLIQELGPPSALPSGRHTRSLWPLALAALVISLFGEWLSRRLRGAA